MEVSVVTPTYNRASTLPRAIESVLGQEYAPVEHVVVDDGSTDETPSVVAEYDDDRVRFVRLSENRGANGARNVGIERATGDVVAFLDSDDEFYPGKLTRCVEVLAGESESCAGVFHSLDIVADDGATGHQWSAEDRRVTHSDLRRGNPVGVFSNVVVRADVFDDVGPLDESLSAHQDYEFFLRASRRYYLRGIPEVLGEIRRSVEGNAASRISDDLDAKVAGQERLLERHGERLDRRVRARFRYGRGFLHARNGDVRAARRAFRAAIALYPYDPLYYYHYLSTLAGARGFDAGMRVKYAAKRWLSKV